MTKIFLDECGHTGQDLLNKAQPFFVLASLSYSEEELVELKQRFFSKVKAKSLKHASLCGRASQQQMVLQLMQEVQGNPSKHKITVVHKKYALVGKIVDLIIEPFAYENNFDIYEGGFNIATTNVFFYTIPVFGGEDFFDELLVSFQNMIRTRTKESIIRFFEFVFKEYASESLNEELEPLRSAFRYFGLNILDSLSKHPLDIAMGQAMLLVSEWKKDNNESITVIHDQSSNMARQKYIWDALVSPDIPETVLGYDRRVWHFPIGVKETLFESDETFCGLQIADVVAGGVARAAKWAYITQDPQDSYGKALFEMIKDMRVLPLLPQLAFTSEDLGTTGEKIADPNDFMARIIEEAERKRENSE